MPNIDGFRSSFSSSRSNRYKITGTFTGGAGSAVSDPFILYAKATSFPGSQIGMIPVSYQGRVIKFTGERQFTEWSIQVYDVATQQTDNELRHNFEDWMENLDSAASHVQRFNFAAPSWKVEFDDILSTTGTAGTGTYKKKMELYNCWPIDISPIDLSYEAADSFAEFTLTFAYDYHIET